MGIFSSVSEGMTQALGAFSVELGSKDAFVNHQVQVQVSATPSTGTLAVAIRSPGADDFVTIGTIDMTGSNLLLTFGPAFVAEIRFTPSSFDAAKTYDVIVTSGA